MTYNIVLWIKLLSRKSRQHKLVNTNFFSKQ
jgi:hypothetical protein